MGLFEHIASLLVVFNKNMNVIIYEITYVIIIQQKLNLILNMNLYLLLFLA